MLGIKPWTGSLTLGIGPRFAEKEDIYRHDRTTARHLSHRNISTKLQDLSRGEKTGWAKYPYFTKLISNGLLLAVVGSGVGAPLATAQASVFSYLWDKVAKVADISVRSEAQNSQTVSLLESASNLDPAKAMGGGDITMDDEVLFSEVGPFGTMADIQSSDRQGNVSLYVVREGDTVAQVAKMFDLSTETILSANDIARGTALRAGQTLVILPVDGIQYSVKKGDTIQGIAKKYGSVTTDILDFNDLKPGDKLVVGDILIVPGGKISTSTKAATPASSVSKAIAKYPNYSGYYTHPVPAGHKTQGIHGNNGVDYGAPIGTPVYAAAEGVVVVSNFRTLTNPWFGGYGNYVIIEHPNGTKTLYGHMNAVYVSVGARLDKGQVLGEVGNTGKSTGPHLHFEVRGAKNPF